MLIINLQEQSSYRPNVVPSSTFISFSHSFSFLPEITNRHQVNCASSVSLCFLHFLLSFKSIFFVLSNHLCWLVEMTDCEFWRSEGGGGWGGWGRGEGATRRPPRDFPTHWLIAKNIGLFSLIFLSWCHGCLWLLYKRRKKFYE